MDKLARQEQLYSALRSEFGVKIATGEQARLANELKLMRKELGDDDLFTMEIIIPNNASEVWIIHKKALYPNAQEP